MVRESPSIWMWSMAGSPSWFQASSAPAGSPWENWIVAKLNLPKPDRVKTIKKRKTKKSSKKRSAKKSKPQPVKENPELEKKLKLLKNLHDKKLIDDNEYKEKRRELLDQL